MRTVLLDTHAWAWTLTDDARLSAGARRAIEDAETVLVSAISFFEIGRKARLGKWPQMADLLDELPEIARAQGARIAELDAPICLLAARLAWPHRDPFDRLIAATALVRSVPLISTDGAFDGMLSRVW